MKKTSINLLCVLIIVTIGLSLVMPVYYIGYSFGYGFAESIKNDNPLITESTIPMKGYDMAFNPDIELFLHPVDSVRAADGVTYPAVIQRADKGGLSVRPQPQAVVPVGIKPRGHLVGP